MGISGLLPLLKSIHEPVHVRQYSGKTLAIDGYCWLHKAAYSCAMDLCLGRHTNRHVQFCMSKIAMLQANGVRPYVVLDGGPLPMKANTESSRKKTRDDMMEAGKMHLRNGHRGKAMECFQRCVDITPQMALDFIRALRKAKVDYVVAPYEADAQLAYLENENIVDGIITEDSDLLPFGCKNVIFKLDREGNGILVRTERLAAVEAVDFRTFSFDMFRKMCILSGCDYLENINGMGLKTAHKMLKKYKSVEKVLSIGCLESKMNVPDGYYKMYLRAERTFRHQRIFDPRSKLIVPWNPIPDDLYETDPDITNYIGPDLDVELVRGIALGEIDPISHKVLTRFDDDKENEEYQELPVRVLPVKTTPKVAVVSRSSFSTSSRSVFQLNNPPVHQPLSLAKQQTTILGDVSHFAFSSQNERTKSDDQSSLLSSLLPSFENASAPEPEIQPSSTTKQKGQRSILNFVVRQTTEERFEKLAEREMVEKALSETPDSTLNTRPPTIPKRGRGNARRLNAMMKPVINAAASVTRVLTKSSFFNKKESGTSESSSTEVSVSLSTETKNMLDKMDAKLSRRSSSFSIAEMTSGGLKRKAAWTKSSIQSMKRTHSSSESTQNEPRTISGRSKFFPRSFSAEQPHTNPPKLNEQFDHMDENKSTQH